MSSKILLKFFFYFNKIINRRIWTIYIYILLLYLHLYFVYYEIIKCSLKLSYFTTIKDSSFNHLHSITILLYTNFHTSGEESSNKQRWINFLNMSRKTQSCECKQNQSIDNYFSIWVVIIKIEYSVKIIVSNNCLPKSRPHKHCLIWQECDKYIRWKWTR